MFNKNLNRTGNWKHGVKMNEMSLQREETMDSTFRVVLYQRRLLKWGRLRILSVLPSAASTVVYVILYFSGHCPSFIGSCSTVFLINDISFLSLIFCFTAVWANSRTCGIRPCYPCIHYAPWSLNLIITRLGQTYEKNSITSKPVYLLTIQCILVYIGSSYKHLSLNTVNVQ